MGNYVLGLDGGGTKTQAALFDINANLIDLINWGATNHEVLHGGFAELKNELDKLLNRLLNKNCIDRKDIISSAFGLAGVDTKKQHKIIADIIKDLGIENFILTNDAYLGIKAGCPSGVGISVINGTGCTVAGIDKTGTMLQIGGQGELTGDVGGGGTIGMEAIRRVYNHLFRLEPYTLLKDILFQQLGITSKYDFMEALTNALENGLLDTGEVGKQVFEAANMGDDTAIDILRTVGRELGRSVNGAVSELDFNDEETIEVVLAGSVNVKGNNPSLVNALKEEVTKKNPEKRFNFIILEQPPVAGAAIWALERTSYKEGDLYKRVIEQFADKK